MGFSLVFAGPAGIKWASPDPTSFPPYRGVVPIKTCWFMTPFFAGASAALIFGMCR